MKKFLSVVALAAVCGLVGCDETMNDHKADAVREQSQADADAVRDAHNQAADNVRNAAGKDALGNARTNSAESERTLSRKLAKPRLMPSSKMVKARRIKSKHETR